LKERGQDGAHVAVLAFLDCLVGSMCPAMFLKVFACCIEFGFDLGLTGLGAKDGTGPVQVDMVRETAASTLAHLVTLHRLLVGYAHFV
jgi:hypothetical protein